MPAIKLVFSLVRTTLAVESGKCATLTRRLENLSAGINMNACFVIDHFANTNFC